ncbi:hypothetical protein PHMEG_00031099, partial [Phytophthora megakarya]
VTTSPHPASEASESKHNCFAGLGKLSMAEFPSNSFTVSKASSSLSVNSIRIPAAALFVFLVPVRIAISRSARIRSGSWPMPCLFIILPHHRTSDRNSELFLGLTTNPNSSSFVNTASMASTSSSCVSAKMSRSSIHTITFLFTKSPRTISTVDWKGSAASVLPWGTLVGVKIPLSVI